MEDRKSAKRWVSGCGAVLCWEAVEEVRERVRDEVMEAVMRRMESMWLSIASWNRGQRSMFVPLM